MSEKALRYTSCQRSIAFEVSLDWTAGVASVFILKISIFACLLRCEDSIPTDGSAFVNWRVYWVATWAAQALNIVTCRALTNCACWTVGNNRAVPLALNCARVPNGQIITDRARSVVNTFEAVLKTGVASWWLAFAKIFLFHSTDMVTSISIPCIVVIALLTSKDKTVSTDSLTEPWAVERVPDITAQTFNWPVADLTGCTTINITTVGCTGAPVEDKECVTKGTGLDWRAVETIGLTRIAAAGGSDWTIAVVSRLNSTERVTPISINGIVVITLLDWSKDPVSTNDAAVFVDRVEEEAKVTDGAVDLASILNTVGAVSKGKRAVEDAYSSWDRIRSKAGSADSRWSAGRAVRRTLNAISWNKRKTENTAATKSKRSATCTIGLTLSGLSHSTFVILCNRFTSVCSIVHRPKVSRLIATTTRGPTWAFITIIQTRLAS